MTTPPVDTVLTNSSLSFFLLVNTYAASGFDLELIKSMPSSTFSTYKTKERLVTGFSLKILNQMSIFTVTIGSIGPNISSFIIRESSGASSTMVGAIFLKQQ